MLPQGLLAALVPTYPASQSSSERSGSLAGERPAGEPVATAAHDTKAAHSIFDKFDINGDGLLSFAEFLLVLSLLSIPEEDISTIFSVVDADGSGTVDAEEFTVILDHLRNMANLSKSSLKRSGKEQASGLLISFFGPDLKGHLKLPTFIDFLRKLHNDLVELEFLHYDVGQTGSIPGIDFARSLVACSDIRAVDALLDKAERMPANLAERRVSKDEFSAMHSLCRRKHPLIVALQFTKKLGRRVTKQELSKIVQQTTGVALTPTVLDILFEVLGTSEGELDIDALADLLVRKDMAYSQDQKTKESAFRFW
ncbi:hypothetical protein DUNSADRAFT_455 [Dunaliella salina]|uniref:EF-hand domain-containing protein n=1 Tax=Dunaliella salina TaxID=3046 RepID=A0ABQ7GY99_DUNSA|nr:hypothetical protein DUNSADRAFT_455 [Dunaliella salina]|eukprot:KAF5839580.1 hypothetical protein DUNSADRAFT_455 [Dunaliella salina]